MIEIEDKYIFALQDMLDELLECKLEVCLVPQTDNYENDDGKMLRVAYNKNPKWYIELCQTREKPEYRFDTKREKYIKRKMRKNPQSNIKRGDIIKVIIHMIEKQKSRSKYAETILEHARDRSEIFDNLCPF